MGKIILDNNFDEWLKTEDKISDLRSGIDDLDQRIKGFKGGRLYVFAGRPAMGKTAIATSIIKNILHLSRFRVTLYSLEMTINQIAKRLIVDELSCPYNYWKDTQIRQYAELRNGFFDYLDIIDGGRITPNIIRKQIQDKIKNNEKPDIIIIDYIAYLKSDSIEQSKAYEVKTITTELKRIAKEFDIPVIVLAQINRTSNQTNPPSLMDLKDSGGLEEDADVVVLIHREAYYIQQELKRTPEEKEQKRIRLEQVKNDADLIVAKNREGESGVIRCKYYGYLTSFRNKEI